MFGATLQASQYVRGTALYRLRTPAAQIAQALLIINLGLSIADTAWLFHHSEVTLRLWLSRAGQHAEQVHVHFFQNLTLDHVQLDELYTTLRDKAYWRSCMGHLNSRRAPATHYRELSHVKNGSIVCLSNETAMSTQKTGSSGCQSALS